MQADAGDRGSIPGSGKSPGGGHGNPFQYSCLENPMNRRAWWSTVLRVTKVQTTETTLQACTQVTVELALWGSRQRVKPVDNNEVVYEYFSLGNVFLCTFHCIHAQIGALSSRNVCFKGKLHMSKVRSFIMCNHIGSENSFQ